MAVIIETEGMRGTKLPDPKHDKYRLYVGDLDDVRREMYTGREVELRIHYRNDTPYNVTGKVSERYPFHCVVAFTAPSGRVSHRSVMYVDILMGYVKVPGLTSVRGGKIPIPDRSRKSQDSDEDGI